MRSIEVSSVAAFLAAKPVLIAILAFFALGEEFGAMTYLGMILVIAGAVLMTLKNDHHRLVIGKKALPAVFPPVFIAMGDVLVKSALHVPMLTVLFYVATGIAATSFTVFLARRPRITSQPRHEIRNLLVSGSISAIASIIILYAISIGPVTLVTTLEQTKPLFVFLIVLVLSALFPAIVRESLSRATLMKKFIAIILIVAGAWLVI
jgi:drug/metabolite transporter (DMT)-like permease